MTGISMSLEMTKARKSFQDMAERAKNPKQVMDVVASMAWREVLDHFRKEEGPNGHWKQLAVSTLRARNPLTKKTKSGARVKSRRKSSSIAILKDTGLLRLSQRFRSLKNEAHVYTTTKYAGYHEQPPGMQKPKRIPQRRFLWIADEALNKIKIAVLKYIAAGRL